MEHTQDELEVMHRQAADGLKKLFDSHIKIPVGCLEVGTVFMTEVSLLEEEVQLTQVVILYLAQILDTSVIAYDPNEIAGNNWGINPMHNAYEIDKPKDAVALTGVLQKVCAPIM